MRISTRAAATAISTLLVFALAACGGSSGTKKSDDDPDTTKASASAIELPGGISFEAPDGWDKISADTAEDTIGEASQGGMLDDMADNMGVTPEQLAEQVKALDVFVAAPHTDGGFLSNINATHTSRDLPSKRSVERQYRSLGAEDVSVEEKKTDAGDALVTTYKLAMGPLNIRGASIYVEHGGQSTVITVSTRSASTTDEIVDDVVDSIAVTD